MKETHDSPEEIIIKLKKLIKKIEQFQADLSCSEITPAQGRIIYPIIKYGKGYSMQELSELVGVDKALVSRVISDLEAKEIIERDKQDDSERKNYKIILSAKGKKIFTERLEKHAECFERWRKQFTKEELQTFTRVLNRLSD